MHIERQPVSHSDKMADYLVNKRAGARIDIETNRHTFMREWIDEMIIVPNNFFHLLKSAVLRCRCKMNVSLPFRMHFVQNHRRPNPVCVQ